MGELLSGSVRREAAPFARNSRLLDPCRNTVKTNRSPFIDRCPKAAMPDVDLAEPVILAPSHCQNWQEGEGATMTGSARSTSGSAALGHRSMNGDMFVLTVVRHA